MSSAIIVLDVLEKAARAIQSRPGPQWTEFGRRAGALADRFEAIAGKGDPQAAADDLKAAVADLLEVYKDYGYVAKWLEQAEKASVESAQVHAGGKRPPLPDDGLEFNPQEIANRYYSLLVQLRETTD